VRPRPRRPGPLTTAAAGGYAAVRYEFWNNGAGSAEAMGGCRICGGLTRRASRLCAACGAHLGDYETLDSRTAELLIPVRRYGATPAVAAGGEPRPKQQQEARPRLRRFALALACGGAALAAAALALLARW